MQAFHNDPAIKEQYLARVRQHQQLDQLIKGIYWANGKGCAVGCTIHSGNHANYESELGIPRLIARLEERLFEGMANEKAMQWPEQFLDSITVGADLAQVCDQFLLWLLIDPEHGVIRFADENGKQVIEVVAALFRRTLAGETVEIAEWRAAAVAAWRAAAAVAAAAWRADDADDADAAVADAAAAWNRARSDHYSIMADKLIELLKAAPVPSQVG